jgi:predicted ABC-type ATPase
VVVAGTNGAGKSSILGAFMAARGLGYFDPDRFASGLIAAGKAVPEANELAWRLGYDRLRTAIDRGGDFAFETTLGGKSILGELHRALKLRREVRVVYVGLASLELHVARVRARVARGGHDIPLAKIRERYGRSLANLVTLIGKASTVDVFDNSTETTDGAPRAELVFRMRGRRITAPSQAKLLLTCPEWAKPVAAAALRASRSGTKRA